MYAPQQLQVLVALSDQRFPNTRSNSQVRGVISSTMSFEPLTPLFTTYMSLSTSTVNTTKGKTQISKKKNHALATRSKKKPRVGKKEVR